MFGKLDENVTSIIESSEQMEEVKHVTFHIKKYFNNETDYNKVKIEYDTLIESFGEGQLESLKAIWAEVGKFNEIK